MNNSLVFLNIFNLSVSRATHGVDVYSAGDGSDLTASGAFDFSDPKLKRLFENEYRKTEALYYRGQLPFSDLISRIKRDLPRL